MCPRVGGVCFEYLFYSHLSSISIHLYEARGIKVSELVPDTNQGAPSRTGGRPTLVVFEQTI